jgi:hypothetical protein
MQVRDQAHDIKHWAYPQAGLKTLGHFKANSLMSNLHPILADINQQVSLVPTPELNSDDEFEDDIDSHMFSQGLAPAIVGASSQGYNALMHRTRYRVKDHKVQLGVITNALAGAYATSPKTKRTAKHFIHDCHYTLPHEDFNVKIDNDNVPRDLRLENVYLIDMFRIKPEFRTGRYLTFQYFFFTTPLTLLPFSQIFQKIIVPLAGMWAAPVMLETLKEHLIVFKSDVCHAYKPTLPYGAVTHTFTLLQVFPNLYKWTTYGITSLLESIWKHSTDLTEPDKKANGYVLELCSALERTLNYMHTGNAKVLSTGLMKPLWLVNSLLQDGMPALWKDIVNVFIDTHIHIEESLWPVHPNTGLPYGSSARAQVLTYGQHHYDVSYFTALSQI